MTRRDEHAVLEVGFENDASGHSGILRYSRELIRALYSMDTNGESVAVHDSTVDGLLRPVVARAWASGFGGKFSHLAEGSTLHATSLLAPPRKRLPLAVTIHDLVAFTHPNTLTPHGAAWHQRMTRRAVSMADAIVVPTNAIAQQLLNMFGETTPALANRVHIVGGAPTLVHPDPGLSVTGEGLSFAGERPYLVFVGTLEPRKGLDFLVPAMASFPALDLILVGSAGWGRAHLKEVIEKANRDNPAVRDRIHVTGPVSDSELAGLIHGAQALVLPSRAEGFGLPIIEAMAIGTPVVHSNDPALVEVAGGCGVPFTLFDNDLDTRDALVGAIENALNDNEHLVTEGFRRSQDFSWAASAKQIWNIHVSLRNAQS